MSSIPSDNTNEKICEYCGSHKTADTKRGMPHPKWNSNPFNENSSIYGKCYIRHLYRKTLPPIHIRRSIRKIRVSNRICYKCGSKTTQGIKESSCSEIWHRHPKVGGKWLCAKCYASWYYDRKRKFQTIEEHYKYLSKLFTGTGNPFFGRHHTDDAKQISSDKIKENEHGTRVL